MEHFLSGCPAFQTKACIICMISIDVFSGDRIKEKIVCTSLPHKFIHLSQDFVLCIQCLMHMNQKYVLKIHICRFIFKEFTNNPSLFSLFSTVDTAAYVIKFVSDLRQVGGFLRVLRFPPPNETPEP